MPSPSEAPDDVVAFLRERHEEARELALSVRAAVLAAEPDLVERVYPGWDGIGFRHPDAGYVCAIFARGQEVRLLFEHGTRLPDPEGLLEGDGAQTRHVTVRGGGEAIAASIGLLVRAAVAERLSRR
jgi:hypothetical protein